MHGATLSNVIFLPRGAAVLELFPLKFKSEAYGAMCSRAGVSHYHWANQHPKNSTYIDNCMAKRKFAKLSIKECFNVRECLFCARDHSVTTVHTGELEMALLPVQKAVRTFLFEQRMMEWEK